MIMDKKRIMALTNSDDRWRKLLDLVQATIELDEEVHVSNIFKCN